MLIPRANSSVNFLSAWNCSIRKISGSGGAAGGSGWDGSTFFCGRTGCDGPLGHGETLGRAGGCVEPPVSGRGNSRPVPDGVRQPEEGRPIGMFEMPVVASNTDGAVPVKTILADGGAAEESAVLPMQALIGRVRTSGGQSPASRQVWGEPHAPGSPAVPKTLDLGGFTEGRGEAHGQGDILERIGVGDGALECLFEAAPLGNDREFFRGAERAQWQCGEAGEHSQATKPLAVRPGEFAIFHKNDFL